MSTKPLISLIITTYNRADLLAKALHSVAESVVEDPRWVEVIVVDNNSTDDTVDKIAQARSERFPFRLHYVRETNQGLSYARNRGTAKAKGKYVVFMDDDQLIHPQYLSKVPHAFRESKAACVGGPLLYYNAENLPEWLKIRVEQVGHLDLGDTIKFLGPSDPPLIGGSMAVELIALKSIGGYDVRLGRRGSQLLGGEEVELQDRLRASGKVIAYHPHLIQYHYLRPERLKKNYWRKHFFWYGRTVHLRTIDDWNGANKYLKVPRTLWWFLFAKDIHGFLGSLLRLDFAQLFERELQIWKRIGQIYEARRTIGSG